MWKPTLWCHRLAMLPPSRPYDPELLSITRQMIVYLAFLPPFPLCSTHIYTAISCFYISSFDLLWVLHLIIFSFSDQCSPASCHPSLSSDPRWSSMFCEMPYASGVCRGWCSHVSFNLGISGSTCAWITYYCCSPLCAVVSVLLLFQNMSFFMFLLLFSFFCSLALRTRRTPCSLIGHDVQYRASVLHNAIALLLLLIIKGSLGKCSSIKRVFIISWRIY